MQLRNIQQSKPQRLSNFAVCFPTVNVISPTTAALLSESVIQTSLPQISPLNLYGFNTADPMSLVFQLDEQGDVLKAIFKLLSEDTIIQIDMFAASDQLNLPGNKFWVKGQATSIEFDALEFGGKDYLQAYVTFSYNRLEVNGFLMPC